MYKPLGRFFQEMLPCTDDVVNFIKQPQDCEEQLLAWLMPEHYDAVATVDVLVGAWHELCKPELNDVETADGKLCLGSFASELVDALFMNLKENFNYVIKEVYGGHRIVEQDSKLSMNAVYTYLGDGLYLRSRYTGPLDEGCFEIDNDELASLDTVNDDFVLGGNYTMWQLPWYSHVSAAVPDDGKSYLVFCVDEYLVISPVNSKTHEPEEW